MDLSSKKLLCAGVCFISATIFVILGKADFQGWAEFIKWVFITYSAGNVGEHVSKSMGK